ncbi:YycH family regulatory protein [Ammoniphilus resinae]|uniref:Regulatory protein YycH of two-component signal transduction system YycFG n=1 Tax=Ammoniphilus resinae TaxID=861532 RepID=A0ABS4GQA0_9BACL|nr:regulatory protein YycH of two-component signal transduction system YycFG [Ammoniphilus resinae]
MWVDKAKTVVLNILVVISLLLSWFLINSQPKYDYLHPAEYVERQPIGEKKELNQLVKPQQMVFHLGQERFTAALPETVHYRIISREMEKWYFFNFRSVHLSPKEWEQTMRQRKALEIIYHTAVPMDIMGEIFTFRGKAEGLSAVKRILIYIDKDDEETYVVFTDQEGNQLEARTAITSRDLSQFYLSLGTALPEQTAYALGDEDQHQYLYLPKEASVMKQFQYFYQPISVSQMIQSLFVDPTLIRQVTERDGTTIYTDGSKGAQITPNQRSLHFQDPMADSVDSPSSQSHFHSVLNFLNEHGGWNGQYILESIRNMQEEESYGFRQYIGSHPIYAGRGEMLGSIEVVTKQSYISSLHRSLINVDTFFHHEDIAIISGEEAIKRFAERNITLKDVEELQLGYRAIINDNHIRFTPAWIVKLRGKEKEPIFIDAEQKEEADGLEKSQNPAHHSLPSA